jgi:hypothetical protein
MHKQGLALHALFFALAFGAGCGDTSHAVDGSKQNLDPSNGAGSCAATTCEEGTYCDDISGEAKCIPLPSCDGVSCDDGLHCELVDVTCVRAPCPPQPSCVGEDACAAVDCAPPYICQVVDGKPTCNAVKEPCALVDCEEGQHCEMVQVECITAPCDPVAECVPDERCGTPDPGNGAGSCAAALCPEGTYCDDITGEAQCIPLPSCDDTTCDAGQHCELVEVECIRAPCPPQPSCVDEDPCALVDCLPPYICQVVDGEATCNAVKEPCALVDCVEGTHCEMVDVQCKKAPCDPVAECVPNPDACAAVRCKAGTHCEVVQIECFTTPCDPIAECVAD